MKKKHYYLVSGEVLYTHPEADGAVGTIRLNSVLELDENLIRVREMGQAQQMLQLLMFKQFGDAEVQVQNVFLYPFTYLGHMTQAEFQTPPVQPLQTETAH